MIIKTVILSFLLAFSGVFFKTLPSVEVSTFEGQTVDIQEYTANGKIQLVSLWATWCGPCIMELTALDKVYDDWKEKYDVEIVAITMDNARMVKRAESMAEKKGWSYTFFSDAKGILGGKLGLRGIPYSMLIDGEGNIVSVSEGYYPGYEVEMEKKIKEMAGK